MTSRDRSATRRGLAVLVLATAGWATPCHAQSPEATRTEARERFDRGLRLFNQQDNQGALAEFLRTYELVPHPLVLYNVGLVYATMGRAVDALDAFDRLLAAPAGLDAEKLARVHAERARQAVRIAELEVVSSVPDAIVDVDGVEAGRTPLAAPLRVDSGQHIVGVVAAGHEPLRKSVTLAGQTRARLEFVLVPQAAQLAHLALTSRVPALEVFVDGERAGTTPLPASLALAPGVHRIELRRPGYATSVRSVELGPGSSGRLDVDPPVDVAALVHAGGDLALRISQPSAVVFIDGESRGAYGAPLRLPAGEHLLRVERSDFFPFQRRVDIPRGGRADVVVELEPTPGERARYRSVNERMRLWGWIGVGAGAALAAGGTGFLIWNQGEKSDAERAHGAQRARWADGGSCDPKGEQDLDCDVAIEQTLDDLDAARKRDAFGWVGLGAGAAALGTGVVLLLSSDDPDRYEPRPESDVFGAFELVPRAWVAAGAYGIGASGRF